MAARRPRALNHEIDDTSAVLPRLSDKTRRLRSGSELLIERPGFVEIESTSRPIRARQIRAECGRDGGGVYFLSSSSFSSCAVASLMPRAFKRPTTLPSRSIRIVVG
jgi:hypothetical protein